MRVRADALPLRNTLSKNVIKRVESVAAQETRFKPRGLWYGFRDSWLKFDKDLTGVERVGDEYDLGQLHLYAVKIKPKTILRLRTLRDMQVFTKKYRGSRSGKTIKWQEVAKEYAGIEIRYAKHDHMTLHKMRLDWYYGWDVISGCVWNAAAVELKEVL